MAVGVRLALVAAPPAAVEMFLPEVPGRSHNQLLDDLASQLAGDSRFVPVRTASRVRLVGKHAIAWIAVTRYADATDGEILTMETEPTELSLVEASAEFAASPAEAAAVPVPVADAPRAESLRPGTTADIPEELTLFDHQHFVEVELAQGGKLIGTLLDSESADFSRLGDHLNRSGYWLRLWTPDQHYLINAGQVVAVTELGEVW
jgi:hypothetical protein